MKTKAEPRKKLRGVQKNKRVLAIGAHPDDIEWGCGGTLSKLRSEGASTFVCVTTDGSKGTSDRKAKPADVAAKRKKEQAKSAKILGVKKVFHLNFEDGTLDSHYLLRKDITEVIRSVKPDIVFTFDPHTHQHNHPDHRVTGQASLDAVYPVARDHLSYPEFIERGLHPHKVAEVFLFFTDKPDVFVDISGKVGTKLLALSAHSSQYHDKKELKNNVYQFAASTGQKHGVEYAEEFRHVQMPM